MPHRSLTYVPKTPESGVVSAPYAQSILGGTTLEPAGSCPFPALISLPPVLTPSSKTIENAFRMRHDARRRLIRPSVNSPRSLSFNMMEQARTNCGFT